MADTAHAPTAQDSPASREVRVFLSSTFRDFMEERDLLVKQVFPELRRKARERGIEVVDVDLRWGITEEESRQGKVIPICLGEIDRCRPYFVGMLGERYGWIPPADQYSPEVIERQHWLKDYLGGVSVTELEILHGVLNDPAMAGRAFFYFRDPAWSSSQSDPGFVCDTPEEGAKLSGLKQRIRSSGFPVAENLADPKALADRIGHDLWELIEQQYPDLDQADALEREERQHASYRRSRLGVYLGGKPYIKTLEGWIDAGQQKILITGESGAGKSALIANWMAAHQQFHPEDLLFAHHLGCSNDASAIRPLLARLIDTAKQLLPEVYGYSLAVPQNWWELVAKAVEALQSLGRWSQQNNQRWIWVLDGLDRLDPDDQNALPWLPLTIPEGVVIVASALECKARAILLERKFKTLTIGPLKAKEQEALIQQYLGRYTKQLIAELRQTIMKHPLAGSPLFLRVLLEELRQCGRYEALAKQLDGYLTVGTIDDLYELVLERLEADGNGDNVRKVITALWASRAGLSEEELLSITGLAPLQWAPIDLALEEALGRNTNRLVLGHDYLRKAVEDRYLPDEEERRKAHSELADWFRPQEAWDERNAEELLWQLNKSKRHNEIRELILYAQDLHELCTHTDEATVLQYWDVAKLPEDGELDNMISDSVIQVIRAESKPKAEMISFVNSIATLLYEGGFARELLLELRELSLTLEQGSSTPNPKTVLISKANLGNVYGSLGMWDKSIKLLCECKSESVLAYGESSPQFLECVRSLSLAYQGKGDLKKAKEVCEELIVTTRNKYPEDHPEMTECYLHLAGLKWNLGDPEAAYAIYIDALERAVFYNGEASEEAFSIRNRLVSTLMAKGEIEKGKQIINEQIHSLQAAERTIDSMSYGYALELRGCLYYGTHDYVEAESSWLESLSLYERLQAEYSEDKVTVLTNLGTLYQVTSKYEQATEARLRQLKMTQRLFGRDHPESLEAAILYIELLFRKGDLAQSALMLKSTIMFLLASDETQLEIYRRVRCFCKLDTMLLAQRLHAVAIPFRRRELAWIRQVDGDTDPSTLCSINHLAIDLRETGQVEEAEYLFRELLSAHQQVLEPEDFQIGRALSGLAKTLKLAGKLEEALNYSRQALDHFNEHEGPNALWTNRERLALAGVQQQLARNSEATALLHELQASMNSNNEPDDVDHQLISEAAELLRIIDDVPPGLF